MEDVLLREIQGNNNNQLLEEFVVVSVGVVISNNDKVAPLYQVDTKIRAALTLTKLRYSSTITR